MTRGLKTEPVLIVLGGVELERETMAREGRGLWSAALPAVLEKYGFEVDVAGPEALRDDERLRAHSVRLVARQAIGVWAHDLVASLAEVTGATVIEGPLPAALATALGVRDTGAAAREGSLVVTDSPLHAHAREYTAPGGTFTTGTSRVVPLDDEQLWPATDAPITEAQAHAWRAASWDVRRLRVEADDTVVLADWLEHGNRRDRSPALVARGSLIGCALSLFSYLGQSHTVEPYAGAVHRSWPRTAGVEAILLGLIDQLYARAGLPRRRVLPWPAGWSWAMHVRHDVDRPITPRSAERIVADHRRVGSRATWYWRARHVAPGTRSRVSADDGRAALRIVGGSDGHEVALHSEQMWRAGDTEERAAIETALERPIRGSCAHGDPHCFRFQGAANLLWAEREQLSYTEMISHAHWLPHRCALMEPDGAIRIADLVCLPHHASFERSSVEGDTTPDEVVHAAEQTIIHHGLLQVLNHPDINLDALFELLAGLPREGRWDAPAAETVAWWRGSRPGAAGVADLDGGAVVSGEAQQPQGEVQVEVREPDGTRRIEVAAVSAQSG